MFEKSASAQACLHELLLGGRLSYPGESDQFLEPIQDLLRRGVLGPSAHTDADIEHTIDAAAGALGVYACAVEAGALGVYACAVEARSTAVSSMAGRSSQPYESLPSRDDSSRPTPPKGEAK